MSFQMPASDTYRTELLEHFKNLIRINTSNPPGGELVAARYVADALAKEGLEPRIFESAAGRGNVWCRLPGNGPSRPLMLIAHLDVVPADPSEWKHPPFEAVEDGGFIYGRGTVDMKHMAAMSMMAMILLKRGGFKGNRDVILCFTADEEATGAYGAGWMVENQPELLKAEYALGEVGGFTIETNGRRIYPIMTAEKGQTKIRVFAKGEGGHGSMPVTENAISKLGIAAYRLSRSHLKVRITDSASAFIKALADVNGGVKGAGMKLLLQPRMTDFIIENLVKDPEQKRYLGAILHNTVTPTVIRAGDKDNVIPTGAEMILDGRYLPGASFDEFLDEVEEALGTTVEMERPEVFGEPIEVPANTPIFNAIKKTVENSDRGAVAVPFLVSGYTDSKHYSKLGIKTYGFTPVRLPPGLPFASLFHAADERIPVEGFVSGADLLLRLVSDFCG